MKRLIRFSIRHPVSILMAVLASVLFGLLALFFIPFDYLPKFPSRELFVSTEFEGIPAAEMRQVIAIPLEQALSPLKGLKNISSVSRDGLCLVKIELHWNTEIENALAECRELIDIHYEKLPSGCKKPIVSRNDVSKQVTLSLALIPADGDLRYARHVADTDIKPRLQRLAAIGSVRISGGEKEQIAVRVHREKMEVKKLSLQLIAEKLSLANYEYPAGTIRDGDLEILFKTSGLYRSLDEMQQTPLLYNEGGLVKLSDIASVERSLQDKYSFFLFSGQPCVKIELFKKQDAGPVSAARQVKRELVRLQESYGDSLNVTIITDSSTEVVNSVVSLFMSAFIGAVAAFAVIWFVCRSFFIALLLASIIPLAAPVSVLALALCGKTLNTMSLSGITVGIGMVVDSGAVVLENIQKKLREGKRLPADIETAVTEVALSNTGSAITTVAVFLPVFFLDGITSVLFADLSIAIVSAVTVSCLWSLTYIPALFSLLLRFIPDYPDDRPCIIAARTAYRKKLCRVFKKKTSAVFLMVGCLVAGIFAFLCLERELLPAVSSDTLKVRFEFPAGTSLEAIESYGRNLYSALFLEPYLTDIHISGGLEKDDFVTLSEPEGKKERLFLTCRLADYSYFSTVRQKLEFLAENGSASLFFENDGGVLSVILGIRDSQLVCAESPEKSLQAARFLGADEENIEPFSVMIEQVFTPDRNANSRFGVTVSAAASVARFSLVGAETAPFYENGIQIPVRVLLREDDVRDIGMFSDLGVILQNGSTVPLRFLGAIETAVNEKVFFRYNRKDARLIPTADLEDFKSVKSDSSFFTLTDLKRQLFEENFSGAVFLLSAVVVLLYLIMAAQFESFFIPFLLLLALPPAFSGAFVFLLVFGKTLNINSVIALVILFGTSVNNSILLYENCMKVNCIDDDKIIDRCADKLRAILITASTTIAALLPFAAGFADSAQTSLAIAVIGGLIVSTLVVLFVVPVIFSLGLIPWRSRETTT